MEESISGFKCRGTWDEVVEHGERITRALRDASVDGVAFDDWDEWRPKSHERLGEDVSEKTAKQASVDEGEGEKAGKTPNEDLKTAGEKLSRSYEKVEEGDDEGAVESWQDSINYVARAADSAGRKALRKVEDTVYQNVMTQLAPYYFDNELISANIQKVGRGTGNEEFVFEVNVNDDDLKEQVSDTLRDFEDEIDRWHIDTQKETEVAEAAEGVEVPATDDEQRSKSTTN
ncbi:hypothetical protein E6P09_02755 [Haloferax mediterranei ATCC 33500]|uniref:Uncharacterized protein n=1 Tax=Haloferax mediterranei (strain ATCC 33500 / DSM 1411 / JCM 8866 / NBRC 14739 / NCIMB 2177 / R-4) TaxID=523841 RepID=I3R8R8_HALMT|nr:DUF5828 family protein [Haloferax mediterranei]AFK20628.1 hypothetical protein HFX_2964 [Haloferax mediterranei ATCC 33500]AHZ22887.1 hypothetical protein BM92_09650 [Haloferax mediterranei ATCC 33500]EMA03052.1 hypothetical protein C439_10725 [Haloferax mediterranei ATCC 33500]MDX5987767.1 DUF5828 family protein [Haloferax mediterranei ATCC 33500]QCQ74246.1 hypothetical protein E6P09_02755 [Haloferax mediterranei ATCC 33500]